MNRMGWLLLVLLLATNLFWFMQSLGTEESPETVDLPSPSSAPEKKPPNSWEPAPLEEVPEGSYPVPEEDIIGENGEDPSSNARIEIPVEESTEEPAAAANGQPPRIAAEVEVYQAWLRDAMQILDPLKREQALLQIQEALRSNDPQMIVNGLTAMQRLRDVPYDKDAFKLAVLPLLENENPQIRRQTLYALNRTKATPEDLYKILPLLEDSSPEVRGALASTLSRFNGRKISGETADAVLKLLADEDPQVVQRSLRSLYPREMTLAVEDRIFELAKSGEVETRHIARAFSSLNQKSDRAFNYLLDTFNQPTQRVDSTVMNALTNKLPANRKPQVLRALEDKLTQSISSRDMSNVVRKLGQIGGQMQVDTLRRLEQNPMASNYLKRQAKNAIRSIDRRIKREQGKK